MILPLLLLSLSILSQIDCFTPTHSSFIQSKRSSPLNFVSFDKQHIIANDTNAIIFEESNTDNASHSLYVSILISPKMRDKRNRGNHDHPSTKTKSTGNVGVKQVSAKIKEDLISQEVQEMNRKIEKHRHHKRKLDNLPCLVLNADYQPLSFSPISVWSWQETAKAVLCYSNKVTVVDTYPDIYIHANNFTLPLPSVIAMNDYVPSWRRKKFRRVAFSRRNVYIRDEYTCQYCGRQYQGKDLSFDHVIPRSKGGRLTWSNVVTSCHGCNSKKGSLVVHELHKVGMKLHRKPYIPSIHELAIKAEKLSSSATSMGHIVSRYHDSWVPFLGHIMNSGNLAVAGTNSTSM